MPALILASGSAVRARLLRDAGLDFEVRDSRVDEEAVKKKFAESDGGSGIEDVTDTLAQALAGEKALAVSRAEPTAFVVGADQILSCDTLRFDKPRDMAEARANLARFRGRTHTLHSAAALARGGEIVWSHCDRARLTMRGFSDAFLDRYLATLGEKVRASVGCYQLEGPGIQLFERIEGDYFTILGLPLLALLAELRRLAVVPT